MGVHDGHRKRMKQRFLQYGLDNFDDVNALELMLFFTLPRQDTNVIAHALMDKFGSLPKVMEASVEELSAVPGVGESAAVLLRLIPQMSRRYMTEKAHTMETISSSAQSGEFFLPKFMYEKDEIVYMVCLDSLHRIICCKEMGRGVVNAAQVSVRKIVELALQQNSAAVILSHNHINGLALPSREDELTTRQIASALSMVGISLADHIIVAENEFVSMADSGLISCK